MRLSLPNIAPPTHMTLDILSFGELFQKWMIYGVLFSKNLLLGIGDSSSDFEINS